MRGGSAERALMKIVYSETHRRRDARTELSGGALVAPFEKPARMDMILAERAARDFGELLAPRAFGRDALLRVHDGGYLDFLQSAWADWRAAGYTGEALPNVWPSRRMPRLTPPTEIEGRIGYYALAGETAITEGTWEAARAAADCALTAQALVAEGQRAAFALARPPGHHAAQDMFGGYCFLNNAALAAQACADQGAARVAVLDVDFHHGNGTQAIFYDRADILFVSIHGAPEEAFPHFLGGADETGVGAGADANLNLPLPRGTGWERWSEALDTACARIVAFAPEALVVSLGVDTFADDPISFFTLETGDYTKIGRRIARLGLPTVWVMEGGYAVEAIGANVINCLEGFAGA